TPTVSRPSPAVYGTRPIATSTMSASTVSAAPPAAGSTFALSFLPDASTPVTLEDSLNVMPWRCRMRWNCLPTSRSMPGRMRSRNSITVTLAPSRRQTEPRRADPDALFPEDVPGFLVELGGMQQRLRRDAPDIEAGAAERWIFLDHRDFEAELRRPDGAHIAAGPGADDGEIVRHGP